MSANSAEQRQAHAWFAVFNIFANILQFLVLKLAF
jgi:hypothetical protein